MFSSIYNYLKSFGKSGSGVSSAALLIRALDPERLDNLMIELNQRVNAAILFQISEKDVSQSTIGKIVTGVIPPVFFGMGTFFYESEKERLSFIKQTLESVKESPSVKENLNRLENIENKLKFTPSATSALSSEKESFLISEKESLLEMSNDQFYLKCIRPARADYHSENNTPEAKKIALANLEHLEDSIIEWVMNHQEEVGAEYSKHEYDGDKNRIIKCFNTVRYNYEHLYPAEKWRLA